MAVERYKKQQAPKKAGLLLVFFSLIFFTPLLAGAAGTIFRLDTDPKSPGSNEKVTAKLRSYVVDLGSAHIIWYVNGEAIKDEVGGTQIAFRTGPAGATTTLDVVIVGIDGKKYRETKMFKPVDVDLLWEADTYVPPFYKGLPLPTHESNVRVVAVPFNGALAAPELFSFSWSLGRTSNLGRGLGKDTVVAPGAWPRSTITIGVDVNGAIDESQTGGKTFDIRSQDPFLTFYEIHPLAGVRWNSAIVRASTGAKEYTLRAAPYFFANSDRKNGKLLYGWRVGGARVPDNNGVAEEMSIEGPEQGTASVPVTLKVDNVNRVMQYASAAATIDFAAQ